MRKHEPADASAALARLAGQVDRIERALASGLGEFTRLSEDVEAHSRTLTDLADLIRRLSTRPVEGDEEDPVLAPEWLTITDPELAVGWLARLSTWMGDVWSHYTITPGCWPWHPATVAELLVCQRVWDTAVLPDIGPDLLAAWHERWRPGVAGRVEHDLAACERAHGLHITHGGIAWTYEPAALDEVALWWTSTHGTTPAPGLTRAPRL